MNNYKCQKPNHLTEDVVTVCLNKECIQERISCLKCETEYHTGHPNQLVDFYFMSYVFEVKRKYFADSVDDFSKEHKQVLKQVNDQITNFQNGINFEPINLGEYIKTFNQLQYQHYNLFSNHSLDQFYEKIEKILINENSLINMQNQQNESNLSLEIVKQIDKDIKDIIDLLHTPSLNDQFLNFKKYPKFMDINYNDVLSCIFSQDGTILVCVQQRAVNFWNVQTQQIFWIIRKNYRHVIGEYQQEMLLSSNNYFFALRYCDYHVVPKTGITRILIYRVKQRSILLVFEDLELFQQMAFSGNCELILAAKTLRVWNLSQKRLIFIIQIRPTIRRIKISPNNELISAITLVGNIYIWSSLNRQMLIRQHKTDQKRWSDLFITKDSTVLISSGQYQIKIWKLDVSYNNENSKLTLMKQIQVGQESLEQPLLHKRLFQRVILLDNYVFSIHKHEIAIQDIDNGGLVQLLPFVNINHIVKQVLYRKTLFGNDRIFRRYEFNVHKLIWQNYHLDQEMRLQ